MDSPSVYAKYVTGMSLHWHDDTTLAHWCIDQKSVVQPPTECFWRPLHRHAGVSTATPAAT